MKKMFFFLALTCFASICFSQSAKYYETMAWFKNHGFTIASDKYCDMKAGDYCDFTKQFSKGLEYQVYAFSDDDDVNDVDLFLYDYDGSFYSSDVTYGRSAEIDLTPLFTRTMTIRFKNANSNYPNYNSRIRVVVAFR
jgi:hypothetical protein